MKKKKLMAIFATGMVISIGAAACGAATSIDQTAAGTEESAETSTE